MEEERKRRGKKGNGRRERNEVIGLYLDLLYSLRRSQEEADTNYHACFRLGRNEKHFCFQVMHVSCRLH